MTPYRRCARFGRRRPSTSGEGSRLWRERSHSVPRTTRISPSTRSTRSPATGAACNRATSGQASLARVTPWCSLDRGHIDAPIPIWPDLFDEGVEGRLFYFYLFALCLDETVAYLRQRGAPEHIIESTLNVLLRHSATYQRKWGSLGVEAGWWMLIVLRGELPPDRLAAVSPRLPRSRDTLARVVRRGHGARTRPRLSTGRLLTRTPHPSRRGSFSRRARSHVRRGAGGARRALAVSKRRVATCRSWIMDDRSCHGAAARRQPREVPTALRTRARVGGGRRRSPGLRLSPPDDCPQRSSSSNNTGTRGDRRSRARRPLAHSKRLVRLRRFAVNAGLHVCVTFVHFSETFL